MPTNYDIEKQGKKTTLISYRSKRLPTQIKDVDNDDEMCCLHLATLYGLVGGLFLIEF